MNTFGKVAVLYGGNSSEREISLISGQAVYDALINKGIDAHLIDVAEDLYQQLNQQKYDRVFIALHGPGGEDGTIQGFLQTIDLPYTGSCVTSSALAMDKQRTKWLWQGIGLPTLPFLLVDKQTDPQAILQQIPLPWAIKPVSQGSTLGVSKVSSLEQFNHAIDVALSYENRVMLEHWIEGKELTVGILGQEALPVIYIEAPQGFYDYEAKYFSDETQYHCPSGLPDELEQQAKAIAFAAYQAIGCRHWGRVDMMLDNNNKLWLLEVNTIPGLTSHSLVPKAALQVGIDFEELIVRILAMTLNK